MKLKTLSTLVALSLGAATTLHAQEYDDRWYFATGIYDSFNDSDRETNPTSVLGMLGIGRYINERASIDVFVDRTTRPFHSPLRGSGQWSNMVIGTSARWYFSDADSWQPYLTAGIGADNHRANGAKAGWGPMFQAGIGLQKALTEKVRFRTELVYRYDFDKDTRKTYFPTVSDDQFGDLLFGVGLTVALGEPSAPPPPAEPKVTPTPPATPSCRDLDDDNDGVNNCDDKCPNTPAGTLVGPDGCPQKVVIDLRGVNFKFDRPGPNEKNIAPTLMEPSAESLAILDQAIDTLKRYPDVRVEVDGHTDSVGTDEYNQRLSERRAKIVYDYLTSHGIPASRLDGPKGFGESRPIDTNDTKEGRQRNRRTELQVENR